MTNRATKTTEFDPLTATVRDWEDVLSNQKHWFKNFSRDDQMSLMAILLTELTKSDITDGARQDIAHNVIQATINIWDRLPTEIDIIRSMEHPFWYLPRLAYNKDGNLVEPVVGMVQELWDEALRRNIDYKGYTFRQLVIGLGVLIPEPDDFLEMLYEEYGIAHALVIILKRGEIERGCRLFTNNFEYYNGMDPLSLTALVEAGLPYDTAVAWLDQSINAKPGYEFHYNGAIERWKKITEARNKT